jgi:galactose mutarotase-like enzyme
MYRQTTVASLPAIALYSDLAELVAAPGAGARITHLRLRRGREWLWRNPALPFRLPPPDPGPSPSAYVDGYDSGGWDECFPTVGPCPLPGAPPGHPGLPDHGELWYLPWQHDLSTSGTKTQWRSVTRCARVPAEFVRQVTLEDGDPDAARFGFDYRVRSVGDRPFPYLWSAHPLIAAAPGVTLDLPGLSRLRVDAVHGRHDLVPGREIPWPLDGGDRFRCPDAGAWAVKLFGQPPAEGRAVLTDPRRGETLELLWDTGEIPWVGVWLNFGGFAGAARAAEPPYTLAVEPCLAAPDRLDHVTGEWGVAPILRPGEERAWRLTVVLREGPS